jgi:hypothetical protein
MYITVRRWKYDPKRKKDIVEKLEGGFLPIITCALGFVDYTVFTDDSDYICSVSTFTTRAGMEEANATATEWAKEHLIPLLQGNPEVLQGETLLEREAR